MSFLQALVLGLVQGLTEFLPVSSSGHLVVVPRLLGWPEAGLAFDTVLHLGTLLAVLIYFRQAWLKLVRVLAIGLGGIFKRPLWLTIDNADRRLLWLLAIGTVPALAVGYFFQNQIEAVFQEAHATIIFLLGTGVFLLLVEVIVWKRPEQRASSQKLSKRGALVVGLAQAAAVLPGLSRSGLTMGSGMLAGQSREQSARFSFLLSAPIILAAGGLGLLDWLHQPAAENEWLVLLIGFVVAAIAGYFAIAGLLKFLQRQKFYIFSLYLIALGLILLIFWKI